MYTTTVVRNSGRPRRSYKGVKRVGRNRKGAATMAKKKRKKSKKGRKASHKKAPRKSKRSRKKKGSHKGKRRNIGRVTTGQLRSAPTDVLESELKDARLMAGGTEGSDKRGFEKLAKAIAAELKRRKGGEGTFGRPSKRKKKAKFAAAPTKAKKAKVPKKAKKKRKAKKGKRKGLGAKVAALQAELARCKGKTSKPKRSSRKASARSAMIAKRARVAKARKICKTDAKRKPVVCRPSASEKAKAACVVAAKRHGVPAKKTCGPGTKGLKKSASKLAHARWDSVKFWGD